MSANRTDATMDNVAGNVKSFVGGIVGNDDMQRDGEEQKAKGDAQYKQSQAKDAAEAKGDQVKGSLQENIGGLFSDDQKAKGKANQASADLKEEKAKH